MIITKAQAINSLLPTAEFIIRSNGDIEWIKTPEKQLTDAEINDEIVRLQAEYETKEYQRKRAAEYPSYADQFDLLYHGGYDAWKAEIDKVKEKYPKP